jgi:hypothetical protein
MARLCASCEPTSRGLEPDFSPTHRPSNGAENPQDHADDNENSADCVQDTKAWHKVSDDEENYSEHNHDDSFSVIENGFRINQCQYQ